MPQTTDNLQKRICVAGHRSMVDAAITRALTLRN
jgi:hypothetical protein